MNTIIEHATTVIRTDTSKEWTFTAGQVRKFPAVVNGRRRYSFSAQNLEASGSANYVQFRTSGQIAFKRLLATEDKLFVLDDDIELAAPATNSATITVAVMEVEYATRGVSSGPRSPGSAPAGGGDRSGLGGAPGRGSYPA
jgi:hypothetical protein